MNLVLLLLYLASLLVIWQFVGYPLFMAIIKMLSRRKKKDYSFQPKVSIVIPTFNEENSIKNRIENLVAQDYPKENYEIIIVDSGSKDKTVQNANDAINERKEKHPRIRVVAETERKGKASAINFGKGFATEDIVLITDANCIFDRNVLKELMPYFKDPKVGVVGGRYSVSNPDIPITASWQFYWDIEDIMRRGEAALDSSCLFNGEMNAWRKDIVDADVRMLSEDLDMAIKIRKKGYKIEYEPAAVFYEPAPSTAKDQVKQRKRTSIGTIQTIFKHWTYFFLPRDLYSLIIFPSHKTLKMISPFLIMLVPILLLLVALSNPFAAAVHTAILGIISIVLLALLFAVKPVVIKNSGPAASFSIASIPRTISFIIFIEYLILLAWADFVFNKYSVLWEKAETTRKNVA